MAGHITDTIVDITRRFEWEVPKEQFDVGNLFCSPNFKVNIGNQVSDWILGLAKEDIHIDQKIQEGVRIVLILQPGDVSLKVEVEEMGIKTEHGYTPGTPSGVTGKSIKMVSKIENFNGRNPIEENICMVVCVSPTKDVLKNGMTVVASLRFYIDRNDYIKKTGRNLNFITQIGSISELDTLADFTVICDGHEFKCHRNILASRSTIFKGMILSGQFVENSQNSTTIEKSSPDMVKAMLEFISKGKIPSDISEKAIDLIDLADRYDLQDLIEICESSLIENLTAESVIETLLAIDLHVPNSQHRQKIMDFIKKEAAKVAKSSHWKKFLEKYPDLVTEVFLWIALPPGEVNDN